MNLAEAYLSRGFLADAAEPAQHYVDELKAHPPNAFLIVAKAYAAVGRYAKERREDVLADFESELLGFKGTFAGRFDASALKGVVAIEPAAL